MTGAHALVVEAEPPANCWPCTSGWKARGSRFRSARSIPSIVSRSAPATAPTATDEGELAGLYTCQINVFDEVAGLFAFPRLTFYVR